MNSCITTRERYMQLVEHMERTGIIPVIKLQQATDAVQTAQALLKGGIAAAEVTFRTDAAEESIRRIAAEVPDVLIGAGTVLRIDQGQRAIAAGTRFIVTPGFNPRVIDHCLAEGIPVFPGVNNLTQIEQALERGINVVKFFPAETSGGLKAIQALASVYGDVRFMPTGGINPQNLGGYFKFNKIVACGGSGMVDPELIAGGNFDEITRRSALAVRSALGFELRHVGIHQEHQVEAEHHARLLAEMFGFGLSEGASSYFVSDAIEITKSPYLGKMGHLAIGTNKLRMAMHYLEQKGFAFRAETAKTKDGRLVAIYLEQEISGFALHLLQK